MNVLGVKLNCLGIKCRGSIVGGSIVTYPTVSRHNALGLQTLTLKLGIMFSIFRVRALSHVDFSPAQLIHCTVYTDRKKMKKILIQYKLYNTSKITAANNEVTLAELAIRVRRLYFLAVIFVATIYIYICLSFINSSEYH